MKITYQDKAQSNEAQEKEFLKLSPIERIYSFIKLSQQLKNFPTKAEKEKKDNFIIEIKTR
jgi:hypothetical protein